MQRSTKIILSVFAVLALLVVIGAALIGVYISRNAEGWVERGKDRMLEGQEAGAALDSAGCIERAIADYKQDTGPISAISVRLWLGGCLQTAQVDGSVCPTFESDSTLGRVGELLAARNAFCARHGLSADQNCQQFAQAVEEFCFPTQASPSP